MKLPRSAIAAMLVVVLCTRAVGQPHLAPQPVDGTPGQTLRIPLQLAGTATPCAGFNATIHLPTGVRFRHVERGPLLPAGFTLIARSLTDPAANAVAVLAYSDTGTFSGPGILCELVVDVPATMATGDYPVILDAPDRLPSVRASHALASADGQQSLAHTVSDGRLVLAFGDARAARGTPLWWLAGHGLVLDGMTFDEAELLIGGAHGFAAWEEYIADTNPTDPADYLHVSGIATGPQVRVLFEPSSTGRVYTLQFKDDLRTGSWDAVPGAGPRPGLGGPDSISDIDPPAARFYRIHVRLPE